MARGERRDRERSDERAPDYDVIVIGAGHNGLAATALLAARGLRVLCLEKNAYVGGMAGTREILTRLPQRRRREPALPAREGAGGGARARALRRRVHRPADHGVEPELARLAAGDLLRESAADGALRAPPLRRRAR